MQVSVTYQCNYMAYLSAALGVYEKEKERNGDSACNMAKEMTWE